MAALLKEETNEEYLLNLSRKYREEEPTIAEIWMLMAKSIFPQNFEIHYESYQMSKRNNLFEEAAESLQDLIRNFPHENALQIEMKKIADSLHPDNVPTKILNDIFYQLKIEAQIDLLKRVAENCKDTMEHCRLILLLINKFPSKTAEFGIKLVDSLLTAEKNWVCKTPYNQFRKLLVCDVLPLVLNSHQPKLSTKQLYTLIQKSLEFYVFYILQPIQSKEDQISPSELGSTMDEVWDRIENLFASVSAKFEWKLADVFSTISSPEVQWNKIYKFVQRNPKLFYGDPVDLSLEDANTLIHRQVFYCTLVILLRSLYCYGRINNPDCFSMPTEPLFVLLEGVYSNSSDIGCPSPKKRKSEPLDSDIQINVTKNASPDAQAHLPSYFHIAYKCWELLDSRYMLKKELSRISPHLIIDNWPWFNEFNVNLLIRQGHFQDAVELLQILNTKNEIMKNKAALQLSSICFTMGNTLLSCQYLLDIFQFLPPPSGDSFIKESPRKSPGRHLHFIQFKRSEIIQYCVNLLIKCFRDKWLSRMDKRLISDIPMGNLLVLCQYDWPKEEELFLEVINIIKEKNKFNYPAFFNYIIEPDVLEEIMYLNTKDGGGVILEICASSSAIQGNKIRAVTRGANKGAKEDLKQAMIKQMGRCHENLEQILILFITLEKTLIYDYL